MGVMSIAEWWPKLSPATRTKLAEDPHQSLSADLVVAITLAAGTGPAWSQWDGQEPTPAHLTSEQAEWIKAHSSEQG